MNRILIFIFSLLLLQSGATAAEKRGGGGGVNRQRAVQSAFPKYPEAANHRGESTFARKVPAHPDSLGNHVTEDHLNRVEFAHGRAENVMKTNIHVTDVVHVGRARYATFYRPEFEQRNIVINGYIQNYHRLVLLNPPYLGLWHRHFFYGGFYYGFHPVLDIDLYFYNPMVHWFYVGAFDEGYYRNWYKAEYDAYPELHHSFEYHGLYFPTDNLKQLLFGVSAMPIDKQINFRIAMVQFTKRIAQQMANGLDTHVKLSNGDISVTHYEILSYDNGVALDGFVTFKGKSYNFRGLLDLVSTSQTDVFVPANWEGEPSEKQLAQLDSVNGKIDVIRGGPSLAPADMVSAAPAPSEVNAEPEH